MALLPEDPRDVGRAAVSGVLILTGGYELFLLLGVFATFIRTGVVEGDFVAAPVVLAIVVIAAGVGILARRAYNLCFILCCFGLIGAAGMVSYKLHWQMNAFHLDWGLFTPFVIFIIAFLIGLIYLLLTQPEIVLPPVPEGPRAPEDPRWRETLLASLTDTGVEAPKSRALKGAVTLAAYIVVAGGIAIVGAMLPPSPAVTITWVVLVIAVLARVRNHFLRETWRAYARSAQDELRRPACRHPVLYLRSFALDAKLATPSLPEILLGLVPLADAEQTLTREMRKVGPVIAIGRPGEALPALGAARFYVSHERWKEKVADVVRVAELVVWATGVTEGLRWEISHLIESLPPEKLVLWAHPHLLRVGEAEREAEWKRFREILGGLFPRPLPERLGSTRFFYFTPEHEPIAVGPSPFRNAQRSALRKLLRAKGYPKPDPVKQARVRLLRWVTAAAVQYRQNAPEREADAWSGLVLALYDAERSSDDVGHPDKILQGGAAGAGKIRRRSAAGIDRADDAHCQGLYRHLRDRPQPSRRRAAALWRDVADPGRRQARSGETAARRSQAGHGRDRKVRARLGERMRGAGEGELQLSGGQLCNGPDRQHHRRPRPISRQRSRDAAIPDRSSGRLEAHRIFERQPLPAIRQRHAEAGFRPDDRRPQQSAQGADRAVAEVSRRHSRRSVAVRGLTVGT